MGLQLSGLIDEEVKFKSSHLQMAPVSVHQLVLTDTTLAAEPTQGEFAHGER